MTLPEENFKLIDSYVRTVNGIKTIEEIYLIGSKLHLNHHKSTIDMFWDEVIHQIIYEFCKYDRRGKPNQRLQECDEYFIFQSEERKYPSFHLKKVYPNKEETYIRFDISEIEELEDGVVIEWISDQQEMVSIPMEGLSPYGMDWKLYHKKNKTLKKLGIK